VTAGSIDIAHNPDVSTTLDMTKGALDMTQGALDMTKGALDMTKVHLT
jgi:hypothetical protein